MFFLNFFSVLVNKKFQLLVIDKINSDLIYIKIHIAMKMKDYKLMNNHLILIITVKLYL